MIISDQSEVSESDDEQIYALNDPILNIQRRIIENISVYNYIPICVNVGWLVDDYMPDDATEHDKLALAVCVLDSIYMIRQFRDVNFSIMQKLYELADNGKLSRLKKKVGWFQYLYSFLE
tara:strand:+ start:103 stop:462 length:360 start_codon:yes stop_codon:yes gene_type:complete